MTAGKMNKEIKMDIVLVVALIAISVALLGILIPHQINVPGYIKSKYLSPAFIPQLFSICLGGIALILLAQTVARLKKKPAEGALQSDEKLTHVSTAKKGQILAFLLWGACCLFVLSLEFFGMLIPSILFLGALMFYFGQKRWFLIIIIMILVPLFLYLFLHGIANVQFPTGILFG